MKLNFLTRDLIDAGAVDAIVARDAPGLRVLSDAERMKSLLATLAAQPSDDVWLFAYGSLIWNPTVSFVEERIARVDGWHRSFCLSTPAGRGSIDNPGLVLGLDRGGHCEGVAFRISKDSVEDELKVLWKREMVAAAYVPRWLDLLDQAGAQFGHGIAFTIDGDCERYAGNLRVDERVRRLATATGALGSSADYLYRTCEGLRRYGIRDENIETLCTEVAAAQAAHSATTGRVRRPTR